MLHEPKAALAGSWLENPWTIGGSLALIGLIYLGIRFYNRVFSMLGRRD